MSEEQEGKTVNGFVFNYRGDLIEQPANPSNELLQKTYNKLVMDREYISASRISRILHP